MTEPDLIFRPFIPVQEEQEPSWLPLEETLELPYETLLTPNQRKEHEKLQTVLGALFDEAASADLVTTVVDDDFTVDTVWLIPDESTYVNRYYGCGLKVETDLHPPQVINRFTAPDGVVLYEVATPQEVLFMPESVAVMPRRPGKYRRGYFEEPRNASPIEIFGISYVIAPNFTLVVQGSDPVLVPAGELRELRHQISTNSLTEQPSQPEDEIESA